MVKRFLDWLTEEVLIWLLVLEIERQMGRDEKNAGRRNQHPKHQGCVWAKFTVADNLPQRMRVGVFAAARSFDAVIRVSNGTSDDDRDDDIHGMAIKLLDVPGVKLLHEDRDALTQDFILADHPVFFARDLPHLLQFTRANKTLKKKSRKLSELPRSASPESAEVKALAAQIEQIQQQIRRTHPEIKQFTHPAADSPLLATYWSQTPYRLGEMVVRYSARPAESNGGAAGDRQSEDFLQQAMARRLVEGQPEARFDFVVQPAPDDHPQWIDDPTLAWDESSSPPIKVATITIEPQQFDSPGQLDFCEHLSYTPWNCLPQHEPLGQINRARRAAYRASSRIRHETTQGPRREPTLADRRGATQPV